MSETNCIAIIPAGGRGTRFGAEIPKQYQQLRGRALLAHTIDRLLESGLVTRLVVATPPGDRQWDDLVRSMDWNVVERVEGGESRRRSVENALRASGAKGEELVAVHDGVRPFVSHGLFRRLLLEAKEHGAAIPGKRIEDTVHQVDGGGFVVRTPPRESLRAVQTPQCFLAKILIDAFDQAGSGNVTDEASMVLSAGHPVRVIDGEESNIKITRAADLRTADENFDEWMAR